MDQPLKPDSPLITPSRTVKPPPRRRRFVVTTILILLVVGGAVWWTRQGQAPAPQQGSGGGAGRNAPPMSVVAETIGKGDIGITLNALGTVTSLATVTVRSQISGYLMKVDFKEGDEVKKGDLIAEIDSRP